MWYSQCQRLRPVRRSETGNFWSGPGTFYTLLYKLMSKFLKILIRTGNFFSLVMNTGYSDNKVSLLKTFLDFSMIPIPLAIFLLMYLICADHLSLFFYDNAKKLCFFYLLYSGLVYNNMVCTVGRILRHKQHKISFVNV